MCYQILFETDEILNPRLFNLSAHSPYWTMVFVGPSKSYGGPSYTANQSQHSFPLEAMIIEICSIVERVGSCWMEINKHINDLLSEDATFLQGDEFVQLLFEDDSFSRSQKYFSILACLKDFENVIEQAKNYWRDFKERYVDPWKAIENTEVVWSSAWWRLQDVEKTDERIVSMKRIRMGFGATREEVKMLRDGVSSLLSIFYHITKLKSYSYSTRAP